MSVQARTTIQIPAEARIATPKHAPDASPSALRGMLVLGTGTLAVTGLTIVVTRIYSIRYGPADLSAVLIFRIYGSVLLGLFGLGMPIALQRNVAFLAGTSGRAGTVALLGLGIGTGSFGAACIVSALFSSEIASFLQHPGLGAVWQAFLALAFFQAIGFMLGLIQIARYRWVEASMLTAATMGLAPLLPLVIFPHASLSSALLWSSAAVGIFALPSFLEICRWSLAERLGGTWPEIKLLMRYGLPRAVGNAAEPILDLMLPWLALVSGAGIVGAGGFAIGLALLRPLNPVTGAMSLVLTPAAAKLAARGDAAAQANQMNRITEWALHIGLFSTVQLIIWADVLVVLWLGPGYNAAIGTVRIICLSLAPSFFYSSIRGIIDGENDQPINTLNLLMAIGVLLLAAAAARFLRIGNAALAMSYFLSRVTLGWLTLRYAIRTHAADLRKLRTGTAMAFAAFLGVLTVCARATLPAGLAPAELLFLGPLSLLLFIGGMGLCGTEWAQLILLRVRTVL
jgi:O-antigen/teichoic acid export membrane protein